MFKASILYDENLKATEDIIVNQGGTACFKDNTLVCTNNGLKQISKLVEGDLVLSYNEKEKKDEYKRVHNVYKYSNQKKTIKIKLKSGKEIVCTEDHQFYFKGGWISIKNILSLLNEKDTKL